ncbi:hypothetical protein HELRODRAFT_169152 [Helobdella robusta]|uniref:Uncharacterized protein n=1 Tax=Helobdella robusta TaxID=6412 RepID=T1F1H4_HELRO|nr:hypothetical protein HELRODRAFT_169152 [Helobdella robusta]ESO08341.1 hypothetical protein HELRODRAFT_169152 [Helobdella robusta]
MCGLVYLCVQPFCAESFNEKVYPKEKIPKTVKKVEKRLKRRLDINSYITFVDGNNSLIKTVQSTELNKSFIKRSAFTGIENDELLNFYDWTPEKLYSKLGKTVKSTKYETTNNTNRFNHLIYKKQL